jgi:hypothetical protein
VAQATDLVLDVSSDHLAFLLEQPGERGVVEGHATVAHAIFDGLDGPSVIAHDGVVVQASAREPVHGQGRREGECLFAAREPVQTVVAEAGETLV